MKLTKAMREREAVTGGKWVTFPDGYAALKGHGFAFPVCYVALPPKHPCNGKPYRFFDVRVNGGLTFSEGNVFGWDYGHYRNTFEFDTHIDNALRFFRERATPKKAEREKEC